MELTVYTLTAALVGSKVETDNDIHLVIADPSDPNATMIAEFPKRECARTRDRALLDRMDTARNAVLAAVPPLVQRMAMGAPIPPEAIDPQTGRMQLHPMHGTAQITGVGSARMRPNWGIVRSNSTARCFRLSLSMACLA